MILNKPNVWGLIWDFCEFFNIGLPFGWDAYVFGKMIGSQGKCVYKGRGKE